MVIYEDFPSNFVNTNSNKKNAIPNTYEQYLYSIGDPMYRYEVDEIMLTGKKAGGFGEGSYNSYIMGLGMKNAKEDWNINLARTRLYAAEADMFGRYAIGITVGGTYDQAIVSLTLAYNLGDGKVALFETHGFRAGTPSWGLGLQLNAMSAYGEDRKGHKFTDVFGGATGESVGGGASVVGGLEYSRSARDFIFTDYGTSTRSLNIGINFDAGVFSTQTVRLDGNWFKKNIGRYVGHRPQLD